MNKEEKCKLHKLKVRRMLRFFFRKQNLTYFLFFISVVLFLAILIPSFAQKLPFYDIAFQRGSFSTKRTIQGKVSLITSIQNGENINIPIYNAQIYCGGYSAQSDEYGIFLLNMVSESKEAIPLIIFYNNQSYIFWADFSCNRYYIEQEFVIDDRTDI